MKKYLNLPILFLFFFGLNQSVCAQNLALSGVITFERKENMHKQFTEVNSWTEERLKHMPKYKVDQFQLSYTVQKSFYKISLEDESPQFTWNKVANSNSVLIDYTNKTFQAEKIIYDKSYRVEDSLPALQWTMLDEYRNIAGYNCRKASTILMDSIYVIAFYTDEIPVNGGPESFNGLPGMILGLVMPRLNLTYFATKNETQLIPETTFVLPKSKSKKTNFKAYNKELSLALKDWGEYASKVLWKANL
ncbi:MAG: GLPGLI family protein [bacterium]|nr:GLPGLI family protein [bacterium]